MRITGFTVVILMLLLVIFGPLLVIWALNTLFALTIPYTLATWFAVLVLSAAFGNTSITTKKK